MPATRNLLSLCVAIVVQVSGFHVDEWQAVSDIVEMKGMAYRTLDDPVVKLTCLSTMWAGDNKGTEAMGGFAKNKDCAAITKNITLLAETKSKARAMVDCSTLDCIEDEIPALDQRCCSQKPCGSTVGKSDMSMSGLTKQKAGGSRRESDQQDCAAITKNITLLAETKSKARVVVDCSTLDCVVDEIPALDQSCCSQKQSAVTECKKKMVGGQSNLFGCDKWWLWLAISICAVQACWKWTHGGSPRLMPWGRGWWLSMASLVAVAEGDADTWYELTPTAVLSGDHYGSAAVWSATDKRMYVFGGYNSGTINTLLAYDVQADEWVTLSPNGTTPSARGRHTAVWDTTNNRMWIFGGEGYNDLHYYDLQDNSWVEVTDATGDAPSNRGYIHAVWDATNNRIWIFGGASSTRYNDLYYYDVQDNSWVEVTDAGGVTQSVRDSYGAVWDTTNSRLWLFGGYNGGRLNDLQYYDLQDNSWVTISDATGNAPSARYGPTAVWDGSRIWIFGGHDGSSKNDLHYYDVEANEWVTVSPGGATPGARYYHHAVIDPDGGRIYIYGGYGGGVTLFYIEIEVLTATATVSSSTSSSATSTGTSTTSQTFTSTTTRTSSTTGTTTTSRTYSTTTTESSSTSASTTTTGSTSTSITTSSSASTSSTSSVSSTTTISSTTSTSTTTASISTSRSATTSSSSTSSSSTSSSSTSNSKTSSISTTTTRSTTTTASTSTSKTMSATTSSTSTTSKTRTQSSTTTATITTATATHTTATNSTTTTSSISSSTTSPTTTTKTGTAIPEGGLTAEELEVLEEKRKEEAAQAVAAVEAAEDNAVAEAIAAIALQGSNASAPSAPGVLREVTISSDAGPVKVAALSLAALGNASAPAKISAGETGAELEVSAGLLGEVAAAAGSDVVLLSVAGLSKDAASSLATDDVRAESPESPGPGGARRLASALRSQPLSINFRAADGTRINVSDLSTPMRMTMMVDDPSATCAFWDEATAQWSAKGVQTLPSKIPGVLECETTHLSIFGGVVDVALRNVILALECSTLGGVLTGEGMAKMVEDGEWLGRPATLVTLAVAVGFLGLLKLAARSDRRFEETLPWTEREDFLMCVKAKANPQDLRAGEAGAAGAAGGAAGTSGPEVEQPPENKEEKEDKEAEQRKVNAVNHKGADEGESEGDEQHMENRGGDEEVKSEEKEEEKKEETAGGLEELPSIFRTVRGIVEGLLDTVSQAIGGDNILDGVKEIISNAESGTIHRAIASLQSHRSGADQATVRALQRGDTLWAGDNKELLGDAHVEGERRRDATSGRTEGSAEDLPLEGEESVPVPDEDFGERRKKSVMMVEVQSVNSEDSAERRKVAPVREAAPVSEDGAAEVQRRSRPRASMVEMIGAALAAARRRTDMIFTKARAMHGRVAEDGAGAAKRYLESNFFGRLFMLFPALHNWLKVFQFSIVVPCIIRTELIELKVFSAACLNAIFFSSTLPAPDADPACRPESGSLAYWVQKFTVGTVSATVGDFIILLLFLMVQIKIEERDEWSEEDKARRRRRWRRRTVAFWFIAVLYKSFCVLYVCAFIANVSKEDANQWLEATAMSLLQDFVLKPAILAIILSVVSSLVLACRPSVKRNIQAKWMEDGSVEPVAAEDVRDSSMPDDVSEASDVKEEGDRHQSIRAMSDPNEPQFAGVLPDLPGMPGRHEMS